MGTVGKITDDGYASCSLLPRIWTKDVTTLDNCIRARKGESVRTPGNRITEMGNVLEEPCIRRAAELLGLEELEVDVKKRFTHDTLELQASLDARAVANNLVIQDDSEWGIYTPGATKVLLNGPGVIENKVTRDYPAAELEEWRGLIQMQGQMEVMGYDWGVVSVLYQSTDFRLYVFKRDPTFAAVLAEKINDFERRIQEEDYWPPKVPEDVHKIYKDPYGKEDVIELDASVEDTVKDLLAAKELEKNATAIVKDLNLKLMVELGNHVKGRAGEYDLSLGTITRKPTPKKMVPANPGGTYRAKTVRVKRRAAPVGS
tara:strand:- start:704 stop:1651 length:948 start_codon:yes stop_codon:yes gene_type:complete